MLRRLLLCLMLIPHGRPDPGRPSCESWDPVRGDPSLYCIDLLPRAEFGAAGGTARLVPAASPFGLAVTADGVPSFDLVLTLDSLPAPRTIGARRYVAWASGPMLSPLIRLGEVANGATRVGPVALEKFTVFVAAEGVRPEREPARVVLRGTSPSSMMQPHGATALPSRSAAAHAHRGAWEMPAPHPLAPIMVPGLEALAPRVTPWQAGAGRALDSLAPPGPRRVLALRDGDTLRLEAGLVRRTVAGRTFAAYAFNGQSPGPLLQVERGARVVVDLENRLDMPTSVHWHGIRLDARFDGAVGVSQDAVPPGGRFRYELVFPDAGIYWYHPHVREDAQQELGLYGNILVRGADGARMGRVNREEVVILDDILLGADGPLAFGGEAPTHALMGRLGNVFLANGEPVWDLHARTGEVVRLHLTNAANARTFNVSIGGARMKLAGGDMGRVEEERWIGSVVIGPAERWTVDARFARPGRYPITNRVRGVEPRSRAFLPVVDTLGWVTVGRERVSPDLAADFATLRHHADLASEFAAATRGASRAPDRTLVLSLRTGPGLPFGLVQALRLDSAWAMPLEWAGLMPMMDWLATGKDVTWVLRDSASGRENMDIDWRFRRGDRILLRLVNDRHVLHPMHHPVHLHGQRFVVVARNGEPVKDHAWKDTVLVPAGSTVDLLVELDNPGRWMMHCHVAEHLGAGMHLVLNVQ